jgi:DNA primase
METKKVWVDFNLIKTAVTMEMLIVQYGLTGLERNGDEMRGVCPIHQGKSKRELSINLVKNTFCCFAPKCRARGNVLDFVAQMERCTIKEAALKMEEWFEVTAGERGESVTLHPGARQIVEADSVLALIEEIETHLATLKQLVTAPRR